MSAIYIIPLLHPCVSEIICFMWMKITLYHTMQVASQIGAFTNMLMSVVVYGFNQVTLTPITQYILSIFPPFALQLGLEQGLTMDNNGGMVWYGII